VTRTVLKTNNGAEQVRYDIRLAGTLGPDTGSRGFADLVLLMRHIVDQPDLIRHGADCPSDVTFHHDGVAWSCEATCFAPTPPEDR
jgi:hypothetical protein